MSAQPKQYNLADPLGYQWTKKAYQLLKDGSLTASITSAGGVEIARVDGKCPYCEDTIPYKEVREAATEGTTGKTPGEDVQKRAVAPRYGAITVTCGCSVAHPNDPAKGTGCGTTFRLEVLIE